MENNIFNYYMKWLKQNQGNIVKQFSRLTITANILIALIFSSMLAVMVFMLINKVDWVIYPAIVEVIVGIITYFYTDNYLIERSDDELDKFKEDCESLKKWLEVKGITSLEFISDIIYRFKKKVDAMDKKMEDNKMQTQKLLQTLVIPFIVAVLSAILEKTDMQAAINDGISMLFLALIIYVILVFGVNTYNNIVIRRQQDKYKQLISDLQGILDFAYCAEDINETENPNITVEQA